MGDLLLRGTLYKANIRFFAIDSRDMVTEAQKLQLTNPAATILLGRFITMAAMMGAMLKSDKESFTITMDGGGPAGRLVASVNSKSRVKGYITNPDPVFDENTAAIGSLVGKDGKISVVRDTGLKTPYIGQSKLISGEIAEDFAYYFSVSEQKPSLVSLGVTLDEKAVVSTSGGIIVQPMPQCPDELIDRLEARAMLMSDISRQLEIFDLEGYVKALFRDMDLNIHDRLVPEYKCDCSREKVAGVIRSLGKDEIRDMIEKDRGAEVNCHFCRKSYHFTQDELENILGDIK